MADRVQRVLDHLVKEVPKAIDRAGLNPNACILASRLGVEVLRAEKIRARPLSVKLRVVNSPYMQYVERIGGEENMTAELAQEATRAGAWCVSVGHGGDGSGWDGHLVVVAEGRYLLDLTAHQVERLRRGIHAEPFWTPAPELERGESIIGRNPEDGCVWIYEPDLADRSFITTQAWSGYRIAVRKDRVISERYGPRAENKPYVPSVTVPLP